MSEPNEYRSVVSKLHNHAGSNPDRYLKAVSGGLKYYISHNMYIPVRLQLDRLSRLCRKELLDE